MNGFVLPLVLLAASLIHASPFTDYRSQAPGVRHKITVKDLPPPYDSEDVRNGPRIVERPEGAWPKVKPGFKVELYAESLDNPRLIRTAPNGDLFVAESRPGRIKVFRGAGKDGRFEKSSVFAEDLTLPFGIAFYPPGPHPKYVYVANTGSVVRFPYKEGEMRAAGPPETVLPHIPAGGSIDGGHWTRDVAFSSDGKLMFVSVGSRSNVADTDNNPSEERRADILEASPEGGVLDVYASGLRNAVGLAVHPQTGELWASVNERDRLGDDLPPDYITHVEKGGFYGWPWFYIGPHQDPRHQGKHPELAAKVVIPDVLIQPHNASLGIAFYAGDQFPSEYKGELFAAEHGSWNRSKRTGYELIRVFMKDGRATGEYEDFLTGFVAKDGKVWGRPVGIAVAKDGSLFFSDDASGSLWRVSWVGNDKIEK